MTTLELGELQSERRRIGGRVRRIWAAGREWYLRRLALQRIAQMSPHLRRDIGLAADDCDAPEDDPAALIWKKAHLPPTVS